MKSLYLFVFLIVSTSIAFAEEKKESGFSIVPTVTSNPTSGTGVGIMGINLYEMGENASPSQFAVGGQYTNTESYNLMSFNKMYFDNDTWQSSTALMYIFNNSELNIPDMPGMSAALASSNSTAKYDVEIHALAQQVLYRAKDDFYVGGQVFHFAQNISPLNTEGEQFIKDRGIEDGSTTGFGLTLAYDTRGIDEKFFPRNSQYVTLVINTFPEFLGQDDDFSNLTFNARHYQKGFNEEDVVALQYFLKHSSEDTPDSSLAALGVNNVLRGFPIGKYKARTLNAVQAEYRYQLPDTSFRFVGFGGYAKLSNGSKGTVNGNRDGDNGDYYSGGVGVRYALQKDKGLDYSIDIVTNNEGEESIYARINQAF